MSDYVIKYPTDISEINAKDDNIDVIVSGSGFDYCFVFITPKNLAGLAKEEGFIDPNFRFIVVNSLNDKIISKAIDEIMKDSALIDWYSK